MEDKKLRPQLHEKQFYLAKLFAFLIFCFQFRNLKFKFEKQ